jgi:hypothetical protein
MTPLRMELNSIRTAKRPAVFDSSFNDTDLDAEVEYSAHLAGRVLSMLTKQNGAMFRAQRALSGLSWDAGDVPHLLRSAGI